MLIAPAAFKGTLTAADAAAALAAGMRTRRPDLDIVCLPVADGGSGTVAAATAAGYGPVSCSATGPRGGQVDAQFAMQGSTAVVELAATSGLALLGAERAPLDATSRGLGDVIRAAIDRGAAHVVVGVGDSACTDGGSGMLAALGARFLDADGCGLADGGGQLRRLERVDLSALRIPRDVVLASDVDNPLLGPSGAAAVFGPQKGATASDVDALEAGLRRLVAVLAATSLPRVGAAAAAGTAGAPPGDLVAAPGAGAGGGVGYAALAVLGATRRPGPEVVLELVGFAERVRDADLVITGEGRLDEQTLRGKAPVGVLRAAERAGVAVVAVAGQLALEPRACVAAGFRAAYELGPGPAADALAAVGAELADRVGELSARATP